MEQESRMGDACGAREPDAQAELFPDFDVRLGKSTFRQLLECETLAELREKVEA